MRRCTRLYRPVFYYLAFWVSALAILRYAPADHVYEPVAEISDPAPVVPRRLCPGPGRGPAAGPGDHHRPVHRRRRRPPMRSSRRSTRSALNLDGLSALGYLNLVAWSIPGMFGVAYRRGLLSGRAALVLGSVMFAVNLALVCARPVRTQPGRHRDPRAEEHGAAVATDGRTRNHGVRVRDRRRPIDHPVGPAPAGMVPGRPRQHRRDDALPVAHPAAAGMHLVFDYLGHPRFDPAAPGFVALSASCSCSSWRILVAAAFRVLRPLESDPLPFWDGGFVAAPARAAPRSATCCASPVPPPWPRSAGVSKIRVCTATR